jgi:peptidoglycan/xylan/chitin deacetylase (PgdA/CDA1 family)
MKLKRITALCLAMLMATGIAVVMRPAEEVDASIPAGRRGIVFLRSFGTASANNMAQASYHTFGPINTTGTAPNTTIHNSFVEIDVTVPGLHQITTPPWWRNDDLWFEAATVNYLEPYPLPPGALPVTIESVTVHNMWEDGSVPEVRVGRREFHPDWFWPWDFPNASRTLAGVTFPHNQRLSPRSINGFIFKGWRLGAGDPYDASASVRGTGANDWVLVGPNRAMGAMTMGDVVTVNVRVGEPQVNPAAGRVSGNPHINATDVTLLRRYLMATDKEAFIEQTGFVRANADVTGSGSVTQADVTRLRMHLGATNPSTVPLGGGGGGSGGIGSDITRPTRPEMRNFPTGANAPPMIAMTYDDGPNSIYTVTILNHFRDTRPGRGDRGTFYVNPVKFTEANIGVIQRMIREGHDVENHGWDHTSHSSRDVNTGAHTQAARSHADAQLASRRIFEITGYWPFSFRAPFFEWGHMAGNDQRFGMAFHGSQLNTNDYTRQTDPAGIARTVHDAAETLRNGSVVLFHDCGGSRPGTAAATRTILQNANMANYEFVTVRELHYYFRNTPLQEPRTPGSPAHMGTGGTAILRNGVGSTTGGTPMFPGNWWDEWHQPNNRWTNPTPPWER